MQLKETSPMEAEWVAIDEDLYGPEGSEMVEEDDDDALDDVDGDAYVPKVEVSNKCPLTDAGLLEFIERVQPLQAHEVANTFRPRFTAALRIANEIFARA